MQNGLRRSLLFMPADNARAHGKAAGLAADALIFDLEDAVALADKAAARQQVRDSVAAHDYGAKSLFLRINHPDTAGAREDVALLATLPRFAGLVIPKVESADTVRTVASWMGDAGCPPEQEIAVMLETPLGILNAQHVAQAHPRLSALVMGTNDLAAALHLPLCEDRAGLLSALSRVVLAARAYGLAVYDGVFNRLRDTSGFARECAEGRALGFDGKTLIHPSQIEAANAAFSPSLEEVEHARTVLRQWESQSKGVTAAGGAMVEELHVRAARRVLALHETVGGSL